MNTTAYRSPLPYPELKVERKSRRYAREMLGNIGGENSEMSAVSLYFYNHLILRDDPGLFAMFHSISIVEMHHLEIFGSLAYLLGADPRLWCPRGERVRYWSPGYNSYPTERRQMLHHALKQELAAIEKYKAQAERISDVFIVENLRRILVDEQLHVELLQSAIKQG